MSEVVPALPARLARRGRWLWLFLRYLSLRFETDQCMRAAAALAYTSLLALVPLFTVLFVSLSAFPAFQDWREAIESFIFRNFVPALGEQVRGYLVEFSAKARGLQAVGVTVLLLTVLAMLSTVESTFNVIWGVRRKRPFLVRFLVYWSVLTLGPVLIGTGMVVTSYVISLPLLAGHMLDFGTQLLALLPLAATTVAFVLFFKLIPYRPVPLRHALIGGVIASVLFEIAKHAFALFVTRFPSQEAIYGAFAIAPIFLTWIYLSWVIVLLGAEITQCLTTFRLPRPRQHAVLAADDPLYCTYRVLLRLHEAQDRGSSLSDKDLLRFEADFGYADINAALENLDQAGWVSRDDRFEWMLARDLDRLTLLDLLRLTPSFPLREDVHALAGDAPDRLLHGRLLDLAAWSEEHLRTPLADLLTGESDEARKEEQ
jgi:membrane protein